MASTEKTYEMQWDCEYCGAKKLLGLSQRFCPTCGGPQNPAKRYFPADTDKVAVEDHPFVGADLTCPACRHAMSRACNNCSNCGSPVGEGKQVVTHGEQQQGQGGQWQAVGAAAPQAPASKSRAGLVLGIVVVAILGLLVARATMKKDAIVTVAGHAWSREIVIERFEEAEEKSACSTMPADARNVVRSKAEPVCTTKRRDNGDGTFKEKKECTEPKEQCTYKVDKWVNASSAKESGDLASEPKWPVLNLRLGSCRGCERTGAKTERYSVDFEDARNRSHRCEFPDPSKWKSFSKGAKFTAKIRVVGGDLDCDSLKSK